MQNLKFKSYVCSLFRIASLAFAFCLLNFQLAFAHEVYVLTANEIAIDTSEPAFDMVQVALNDLHHFFFWAIIVFIVVSTVFFASIFRFFEDALDPVFDKLKRYAPAICRATVGIGLIAGAYYRATYGPELPLLPLFGALTPYVAGIIAVSGILIIAGIWVRLAALVALFFYAITVWVHGVYMLTYVNYFGEFVILILMGTHGRHHEIRSTLTGFLHRVARVFAPYSFAFLRITFGLSLLYSSFYAKILHNNLALQVASVPLAGHPYPLAHYFGMEPHFLVLGAALIELLIGSFYILGIEIRWTSLFLLFWLSLSLWYFGESVWPHIILIGIPVAFFFHGYDRWSLEGRYFKKRLLEPIL
jgi:uncharacterized membrane protein YphA (DoxX/SURF4 family)